MAKAKDKKKEKNLSKTQKKQPGLKKMGKTLKIPKTVQQTIPYYAVYEEEGIIEITPGTFTRSYLLEDINYQIAKMQEQEEMFRSYGEILNGFNPAMRFQFTINKRNINQETFIQDVLKPMRNDVLDDLRKEQNAILLKKIKEGRNNMTREIYLTVALDANSFDAALVQFSRLDSEIIDGFKRMGDVSVRPFTTVERLEILHDIYNIGREGAFGMKVSSAKEPDDKSGFSFKHMRAMGMTTKDCIGPESFEFKGNHGRIGEKYFRALFLRDLPAYLVDNVLSELTNTECNMLTSLNFQAVSPDKAMKAVKRQLQNVNANLLERQKSASKAGYSIDLISPELQQSREEADELFRDLSSKNQRMFLLSLVIVHFADTKEDLDRDTKSIQAAGNRLAIDIKMLLQQQENALTSALPLAFNKLKIDRTLTTESSAVFMPFMSQELNDRHGGMYYGVNAISKNLILFDRRKSKNANGFIFGTPGAGKSVTAKQEMTNILLDSDDDVIVIDPEGEYAPMAELLGGEVIEISAKSDAHINPMDMSQNYGDGDQSIILKSDFIISLCELISGDRYGLTPIQRSIIDRCTRTVYSEYLCSYNTKTGKYDKAKLPTLKDFYDEMRRQREFEAKALADGLEIYVEGSLNIFAHHTNVDYHNRFVVYDIKDMGSNLKSLGLLIVLDNIWNRIVEGRKIGKNVWFFIDEIYLLFKTETSANFLYELYKRARKYGGIPTGITQNVTDVLENPIAHTIINNCDFVCMLNQAQQDKMMLAELLNISPAQQTYITNSGPGEGLLYTGACIVPFINKIPTNTKLYKAMTTKLSEVQTLKEKGNAD